MVQFEHFFELINFIFLSACVTYFYRKYGAPLLKKAVVEKKAASQLFKEKIAHVRQRIVLTEQAIAQQEDQAHYLLGTMRVWSTREQEKKVRKQFVCAALQEKVNASSVIQEKSIALTATAKELMPEILHQVRQELSTHFNNEAEQRRVIQKACRHLTQAGHHG